MKKNILMILLTVIFIPTISNGQLWKDIKKAVKDVKETVKEVGNTGKQINSTSKDISNTINSLKKTWTKDTSQNIKYRQVPDYRTREEIEISTKQELIIENGEFKNLNWNPIAKFNNQVFPSFIIGWASYKGTKTEDMGSSLGFYIRTNLKNVVLKWEIECSDKEFFNIDSGFISYNEMSFSNYFMPRINWNYKSLTKHNNSSPINIHFRLIDPITNRKVEKLVNINLRSINDCITCYNKQKYNYLFASYVNEEHPEIDKILRKMLDTKMVDAILGYQGGEKYVDIQVAALWRVLHEKGFQYSSITDNASSNDAYCNDVFSQSVRTFENSIATNQANCVDGTVLFASILKKMGIKPLLINVPGHCFLGYYLDDEETKIRFLETTMVSNDRYIKNPKAQIVSKSYEIYRQNIPQNLKLSDLNKAYYAEFYDALVSAKSTYDKNIEKNSSRVVVINVEKQRQFIKPIPYYQ